MVTRFLIAPDVTRVYTPADGAAGTDHHNLPDTIGAVRYSADGKKAYRFVQCVDLAFVAGDLVCFDTENDLKHATPDRSGGTSENTRPAGLALVATTLGLCSYIQVKGLSEHSIVTDGGVSAGESLIAHATTDGGADSNSSAALTPGGTFGQALDDDTGTALAAGLVLMQCDSASG